LPSPQDIRRIKGTCLEGKSISIHSLLHKQSIWGLGQRLEDVKKDFEKQHKIKNLLFVA
jgi:hypothetical protein